MLQTVWNGLVQGALYAVVALGYTMVYGILQLINFAHGEVLMLGAYTGVVTLAGCAGAGAFETLGVVPCLAGATLAAMAVSAAWGASVERTAYRPLRGAPSLSPLIGAIGVSMFLQNFVMLTQGAAPIYAPTTDPAYLATVGAGAWSFGPFHVADFPIHASAFLPDGIPVVASSASLTGFDVVILVTCVALMAGLWLFVQRTRLGTAMRATAQDRVMAGLVGIDVDRVISATFVVGSALAAVAGVLLALVTTQAKFDMGFLAGMKAFTAAVLGGIGNVPGAMLGGVLLGLAESVGVQTLDADYQHVYAFVVLLVVLVVRPKGILGERVAEKV